MTLTPFPPEALDDLALRIMDLAAQVREMANQSRENQLSGFQLHGNKVHEWMGRLEEWAIESNSRLDAELLKQKGARRGRGLTPMPPSPYVAKRPRAPKK